MNTKFGICSWFLLVLWLAGTRESVADPCRQERLTGQVAKASSEANRAAIKEFRDLRRYLGRKDLIFAGEDMYAPLLFAHRGGVLETPESTLKSFRYALKKPEPMCWSWMFSSLEMAASWSGTDLN